MTSPVPPAAPEEGVVVLWQRRADALGLPPTYVHGYHLPTDAEYRALPASRFDALLAENAALREALRFYADLDDSGVVNRRDESNYTGDPDDVTYDRGAKARAALAGGE